MLLTLFLSSTIDALLMHLLKAEEGAAERQSRRSRGPADSLCSPSPLHHYWTQAVDDRTGTLLQPPSTVSRCTNSNGARVGVGRTVGGGGGGCAGLHRSDRVSDGLDRRWVLAYSCSTDNTQGHCSCKTVRTHPVYG